jgi:hypothetical protein
MDDVERATEDWLRIVRGEFLEIPGLRLTRAQIEHLWGLNERVCAAVLGALLEQRFLRLTPESRYVRADPCNM